MVRKVLFLLALFSQVWAYTAIGTTNITFADTIIAKVVGEIYKYPVVILGRSSVDPRVVDSLKEMNITDIVIIGGPYVVSPKVEEELRNSGFNVTRLWGVTRYETSAIVAQFFWNESKEAVIVTRELTNERATAKIFTLLSKAIDTAVEKQIPILITPAGTLDINVANALESLGVNKVYLYTLSGNISNLVKALEELNITVETNYTISRQNCTIVKISETEPWQNVIEYLFTDKCVKFVPSNTSHPRTLNRTQIWERYKRILQKQKEKILKIIERRKLRLYNELQKDLLLLERIYNQTKDEKILKLIEKINKTLTTNATLNELIQMLAEVKEYKWKYRIYLIEERMHTKEIREIVKKLRERIRMRREKMKKLVEEHLERVRKIIAEKVKESEKKLQELTNITKKVQLLIENKNATRCIGFRQDRRMICTQEYRPVCGIMPDGSIKVFSNPCVACANGAVAYYPCENIVQVKARLVNISIS